MLSRLPALFFALCLILMTTGGSALASEVQISIRPDKATYRNGEIAYLSIDIQNNTDKVVSNLHIRNFISDGLAYVALSDAEKTIAAIQPGQQAHHVVRLRVVNIPKTGDGAFPTLWMLLIVAASCVLIWQFGRFRASRKNV